MSGVADSGIKVSDFTQKGNQGIGTFTKIQGELILLDGKVYQLQASGSIRIAGPEEQLPYAVATHFQAQETVTSELKDKGAVDQILKRFDEHAANCFISYRIDGKFKYIKARTVRGQEYEDQPLSELGDKQAVQDYSDIEGTIIGFRAPTAWQGFMVAGEHMHFIDRAREVGGHLLELESDGDVSFGIAVVNNIHIELPTSRKFNAAKLSTEDDGIKGIEG